MNPTNSPKSERFPASRVRVSPIVIGLVIAWAGPVLLAMATGKDNAVNLNLGLVSLTALWMICMSVLWILRSWEQQPLASIGLQRFRLSSLVWAILLVVFHFAISAPLLLWVLRKAGHSVSFDQGESAISLYPIWFRTLAVITAGTVEEILYRGYTIERLSALIGNRPIAAIIQVFVFAFAHYPLWGLNAALYFLLGSLFFTSFYLWKRDLVALIISHTIIDFVGLVVIH